MNITYEDFKDYCSSGLVNYSLQDFTAFSIMFVVPESRIERISSALELYWIALGGVVGAYVGISSWTRRG